MTSATEDQARERPILFSAAMVRAVLDGSKTQTRRAVNPQPIGGDRIEKCDTGGWVVGRLRDSENAWRDLHCPFGERGDRLYVREAFSGKHDYDQGHDGKPWPPGAWFTADPIWYWADGNPTHGDWTKPKPSIHMPRWASRIDLEVTGVRVERLQDISEEDAKAGHDAVSPFVGYNSNST